MHSQSPPATTARRLPSSQQSSQELQQLPLDQSQVVHLSDSIQSTQKSSHHNSNPSHDHSESTVKSHQSPQSKARLTTIPPAPVIEVTNRRATSRRGSSESRRHPIIREDSGPTRKRHASSTIKKSQESSQPQDNPAPTTVDLDNIESLNPVRPRSSSSSSVSSVSNQKHHSSKNSQHLNHRRVIDSPNPTTTIHHPCLHSSLTITSSNLQPSGIPGIPLTHSTTSSHESASPLVSNHVVDGELQRIHRLSRTGNPLEDIDRGLREYIDLSGDQSDDDNDDLEELVRCPNCRVLLPPSNLLSHRLHCERRPRRHVTQHNSPSPAAPPLPVAPPRRLPQRSHPTHSPVLFSQRPVTISGQSQRPSPTVGLRPSSSSPSTPTSPIRGLRTRGSSSPLLFGPPPHRVFVSPSRTSSQFPAPPFRRTVGPPSRSPPRQGLGDPRRSSPVIFSRNGLTRPSASSTPGTISPIFGSSLFGSSPFGSSTGGISPIEITPRGNTSGGRLNNNDPQSRAFLHEAHRILLQEGQRSSRVNSRSATPSSRNPRRTSPDYVEVAPFQMGADFSSLGRRSPSTSRGRPAPPSSDTNNGDDHSGILPRTTSSPNPSPSFSRALHTSTPRLFTPNDPSSSRDMSFVNYGLQRRSQTPSRQPRESNSMPETSTDDMMYRCRHCHQMILIAERDDHNLAHQLQDHEDAETEETVNRAARQFFHSLLAGRPNPSSSSSSSGNGFGIQFTFGTNGGNQLTFTGGTRRGAGDLGDNLGLDHDPFHEIIRQLQSGQGFASALHQPPQPPPGTPQHIIDNLPTSSFTPPEGEGTVRSDEETCMVCLDNYTTSDQLRRLPCMHAFHVTCIDEWLQRSVLCPVCKVAVHPSLSPSSTQSSPTRPTRGTARGGRARFPGRPRGY